MSNPKYLNGVLSVIAVCLIIITLSLVGVFPKATAATSSAKYVSVPLNSDGSINVRLNSQTIMMVDIQKLAGKVIDNRNGDLNKPLYLPVHDFDRH